MPIRVNDLKAALDKLNEPQAALEKMDQPNGKRLKMVGDMASTHMDTALQSAMLAGFSSTIGESMNQSIATMHAKIAAQTQANMKAMQAGIVNVGQDFGGFGEAVNTLLANLEESERRKREALDYYRKQAYDLISAAHLKLAIPNIDWSEFIAAQRPSLTEQGEAAGDPKRGPVIAERSQLAAALDTRFKEREIRERAANELLAYAWATWGGWEDATIDDMLEAFLPDAESWGVLSRQVLEPDYLRKILATKEQRAMLPDMGMQWDADGRGFLPSYGVHRVVGQGLGRLPEWGIKSGNTPEHAINKYGVRGHLSISGNSALMIWEGVKRKAKQAKQYGDILPDVYLVVVATILTHREKLDLFGNGHSYISIDSAMSDLGIRKSDRKYDPEDIEKVRHAIQAIGDITIRGVRTAYLEGTKPIDVPFEGPLWRVMDTVPKARTMRELEDFLSGEHGDFMNDAGMIPAQSIAGFSLALGAGLHIGHDEIPQEARTMRAIMAYPPVHGRFKRRLGYSLSCEFRLRYQQQNWSQPYTVRDVLEDAPIPIDDRNPARTYKLFHEALEALQADGVVGTVRYVNPPREKQPFDPGYDTGKRGWLEPWLNARIVIMPPADIEAAYREALGDSRQRRRRRTPALKASSQPHA